MQNREKQAAYRARMAEKGMVQVLEWVPKPQRELFKAIAQALRDGRTVSLAETPEPVTNRPPPEPPEPVTSNLSTETAKPQARAPSKAHHERQAKKDEQWNAATELLQVIDEKGKGHEARVLLREQKTVVGFTGDSTSYQHVTGLIRIGAKYQSLDFTIWPKDGLRPNKPSGWRIVPKEEIARARKRVSALHPDKGGPGGDEYQAAKALLDALTGRAR